jgi:hypothetical protein
MIPYSRPFLQDGLGGNAKTLMFVNISPADYNCDETASSLTYALRVKNITNSASKQVLDPAAAARPPGSGPPGRLDSRRIREFPELTGR